MSSLIGENPTSHVLQIAACYTALWHNMTAQEVGVGARVRLTKDGQLRRLWGLQSGADATIRDARLVDNGSGEMCVRVNVDGERQARIRTMQLTYLDAIR